MIVVMHVVETRLRNVEVETVFQYTKKAHQAPLHLLHLELHLQAAHLQVQVLRKLIYQQDGLTLGVFSACGPCHFVLRRSDANNSARDNIPSKEDPNMQLPTFPYKVWDTQTNDAVSCITRCQQFGFNAAGLEYSSQCCMHPTLLMSQFDTDTIRLRRY